MMILQGLCYESIIMILFQLVLTVVSELILLNFAAGGSTEVCGCIEIIDDKIKENTENLLIRLSASGVTIDNEGPVW